MTVGHANARNQESRGIVVTRCQKLARFSEDLGSTRRTFLCPPMHDCHREIARWLEPIGVEVRIDAAGNLRGVYPAVEPNAPTLLIGSHLDTVPNAGAYDGILGVVLAVALLDALDQRRFPFAIEVVGFSEEEGVRFGVPFIGSRALIGTLDEELLSRCDARGNFRAEGDRELWPESWRNFSGCLESRYHCLRGVSHRAGSSFGETGATARSSRTITGQSRLEFTFVGRANHAGTTPMDLRYDAIAAAAEWITAVERLARDTSGLVATVGRINAKPGATNVIAGEARLTLDVRHGSDDVRTGAVENLIRLAEQISRRRGLSVSHNTLSNQQAVPMDPILMNEIEEAIRKTGCEPHHMVSGAGHDAMIMAEKVPTGMIFLRTPGGISHDPAESVEVEDVAKAIECGLHLLDQIASSKAFQKRKCRA